MFLKCSVNIFTLGAHCQFPFPIKGTLEINLASQSVTRFSKTNYRMLFIEFSNDLSFLGLLILILHSHLPYKKFNHLSLEYLDLRIHYNSQYGGEGWSHNFSFLVIEICTQLCTVIRIPAFCLSCVNAFLSIDYIKFNRLLMLSNSTGFSTLNFFQSFLFIPHLFLVSLF